MCAKHWWPLVGSTPHIRWWGRKLMATHGKTEEFDPSHETCMGHVRRTPGVLLHCKWDWRPSEKAGSTTDCKRPRKIQVDPELVPAPQKPAEKSYDELVALVKLHYTPKLSVIVQRFQFHSWTQKPGETVATFVAELRQLSEFCEFGASFEDMLRDQLVCGTASGSTQRRLLVEPDLTLQKAQNLTQAIESADKNAEDLQGQW